MILSHCFFALTDTNLSRRRLSGHSAAIGGGLMLSLTLLLAEAKLPVPIVLHRTPLFVIGSDRQGRPDHALCRNGAKALTHRSRWLIAEELDVSLKQVWLEHATTEREAHATPLLGVQAPAIQTRCAARGSRCAKAGAPQG